MDVVQMLLKHLGGQGLEERNDKGRRALHLVAECHCSDEETRTQLVAMLLSKGAQVNVKDEDGITPLLAAMKAGRIEMAVMLLKHMDGEGLEAKDEHGSTVLHLAAQWGHAELVTSMLNKGVQPIPKDGYGLTPLMRAISGRITEGHMAVVEMLLQRMEGEGLEAKDEQGRTALHLAAKCRLTDEKTCTQLVAMLLKKGAQVDVKDKDGITPLLMAIGRGYIEVARMLLQHMEGEGLEEKDKQGRTAMHLAASDCAYDILALNFLLEHGATANIKDCNGVTPLMNAALGGSLTGVQLLVQHVGEQGLQERDQEGRTVLHCAIGGSATPLGAISFYYDGTFSTMVQALLEAGADPSITDREGRTPRALAMEFGLQRCGGLFEVML
jgi:ankyrin repeat protein